MTGPSRGVRRPSVSSAAILVVTAGVAAAVTWSGTAGWSPATVRATADVNIAPIIGTFSNYEVATHAADFTSAYGDDVGTGDVAGDPDAPGAFVDSSRVGNGTIIRVTYVASTADAAESGLRRQVRHALDEVSDGIEQQLDADVAGAELARKSLESEGGRGPASPADTAALNRVGEIVADATSSLKSIQVAQRRNADRASSLQVDTSPMSTTSTRARASVAGGLAALVLTGGALALLTVRRRRRHEERGDTRSSA